MIRRFRRRQSSSARLLALWLLLLSVVWQPIMASVGDLHEIAHGADVHALASHAGDADSDQAPRDNGPADERDSLLHAVMCASHCCGHAVAMPTGLFACMHPLTAQSIPARAHVAPQAGVQNHPFRPPIAI